MPVERVREPPGPEDAVAAVHPHERASADFLVRPVQESDEPDLKHVIETVMTEFGATGEGHSIHDAEVAAMAAAYARSGARYLVLERSGRVVGGAGYAPLLGGPAGVCELRKMYVLPEARGFGMGRHLLEELLAHAPADGYTTCYLETIERMAQARKLYESVGFRRRAQPLGATGHACESWYEKALTAAP